MEPGGQRQQQRKLQVQRQEAAEFYRRHQVTQRLEEALNALYPLRPADLFGELVVRGGEAARRHQPPVCRGLRRAEGLAPFGAGSGAGRGSPQ